MLVPDAGTSWSNDLSKLMTSAQIDELKTHLQLSNISLSVDDRQPATLGKDVNALEQSTRWWLSSICKVGRPKRQVLCNENSTTKTGTSAMQGGIWK
jgi:hypothetical protein